VTVSLYTDLVADHSNGHQEHASPAQELDVQLNPPLIFFHHQGCLKGMSLMLSPVKHQNDKQSLG